MLPDQLDPVDAAINAVEGETRSIQMVSVQVQLPPLGRPAQIALPVDISEPEAFHLLMAMPEIIKNIRAANPATRLVTPNGAPLR